MSETREPLRRTFDTAADLYERARPSDPEELFDDLVELAKYLRVEERELEADAARNR